MRLRYVAVAALFALVIWVAWKAPIPGMKLEPMQPLPAVPTKPDGSIAPTPPGSEPTGVPTFQQAVAQMKAMEHATYQIVSEDPKMHAMRQAIRDTAPNGEAFPCSADNRHHLAEAVAAYGNFIRDHVHDRPTETMLVNGQSASATGYLDQDVNKITMDADIAGVVHRTNTGYYDVPAADAIGPASRLAMHGARFVCGDPS
jgi:hypothetical protein